MRSFFDGGLDDLVVSENVLRAIGIGDLLTGHLRACTVGTDDHACRDFGGLWRDGRSMVFTGHWRVMHPQHSRVIPVNFVEQGLLPDSTGGSSAFAQKFIKVLPVDHAHKTVVNVHVNLVVGRRNHACATNFGHQQMVWNIKVFDQARRYRTATWLRPAFAVQQ